MKRVLVYSHDTYGLGNIRRMLTICEHLCEVHPDVSILIVSGSPMLHAFRLSPRIDYVKLPCLARTSKGEYEVKSLGLDYGATIRMRQQILVSVVEEFRPDLVVVDKKPFGVNGELRKALELANTWERRPATVLVLRDILDDPGTTIRIWEKNDFYSAIESFFDSVLVLGDMDIFDVPTEYEFPRGVASMVEFCGYLGRAQPSRSKVEVRQELGVPDDVDLVLVTPGGGEDGGHLTDSFLGSISGRPAPPFHSLVIAGPEMPERPRIRLHEVAESRPDVAVIDFTRNMADYIGAADLVVSMAGYNTVCEVLSARRPTVVVPRVRPVQEQLIRAEMMAKLGWLKMIHPDELTPDLLYYSIVQALNTEGGYFDGLEMLGLQQVEKHLSRMIGDA